MSTTGAGTSESAGPAGSTPSSADSEAQGPSAAARAQAHRLATRMPFVHFPSGTEFDTWSTWGAFKSWEHLGRAPASADAFDVLRGSHVFAYAGPCCFAQPKHAGDVAAYLAPDADLRLTGEVSPFDSGALEGEPVDSGAPEGKRAHLRPWAERTKEERWAFHQSQVLALAGWRQTFEAWLLHCYEDDPGRYLESSEDRYGAGEPRRTRPPEILEHNGVRGREQYGPGRCADRRAWTWEVRFSSEVPFGEVRLLQVPNDRFQDVLETVREQRLGFAGGAMPEVFRCPQDATMSAQALYLYSHAALEALLKP